MDASQQDKIAQFCAVTGEGTERATFFLDANSWEMGAAVEMFFSQNDEPMQVGEEAVDNQPPPVSASAPQPAQQDPPANPIAGRKAASSKGVSKNKKFMTVSDYKNQDNEDSDNEGQQGFYAGGSQNSGNMILGPKKSMKDKVQSLFNDARKHGAKDHQEGMSDDEGQGPSYFGGQGHKLGDSSSPTTEESQPSQPLKSAVRGKPKVMKVRLAIWKDGFTVQKGDDDDTMQLRKFEENNEFMEHIKRGRIPPELIPEDRSTLIDIRMEDHHEEDFVAPKKKFKAFTGQGCTLGSTPSTSSADQAASHGDSSVKPQEQVNIEVDPSKPKTRIQIRLADGSRIVQEFNHSHTVGDVCNLAQSRSQGNFIYMTTFPNRELKDMSQSLSDAKLLNASVQQKKV